VASNRGQEIFYTYTIAGCRVLYTYTCLHTSASIHTCGNAVVRAGGGGHDAGVRSVSSPLSGNFLPN